MLQASKLYIFQLEDNGGNLYHELSKTLKNVNQKKKNHRKKKLLNMPITSKASMDKARLRITQN